MGGCGGWEHHSRSAPGSLAYLDPGDSPSLPSSPSPARSSAVVNPHKAAPATVKDVAALITR